MEEKYEQMLSDFLAGNQTEAEKAKMEKAIASGELKIDTLNELTKFNDRLTAISIPEPSESMRSNFYQILAEEKQKTKSRNGLSTWLVNKFRQISGNISWGQLTYSVAVLALGIFLGFSYRQSAVADDEKLAALTTEMQQMKKMMMLTLLEQPSATDRLKAVSLTADMETADDKVIKSLLQTLNNDPSVNVRLAAIEALYQHASNPIARAGLVSSITRQDSPLVQLALADVMVAMQEKDSVQQLKQLLQQSNLNEAVKEKVKESIQVLI